MDLAKCLRTQEGHPEATPPASTLQRSLPTKPSSTGGFGAERRYTENRHGGVRRKFYGWSPRHRDSKTGRRYNDPRDRVLDKETLRGGDLEMRSPRPVSQRQLLQGGRVLHRGIPKPGGDTGTPGSGSQMLGSLGLSSHQKVPLVTWCSTETSWTESQRGWPPRRLGAQAHGEMGGPGPKHRKPQGHGCPLMDALGAGITDNRTPWGWVPM